MMSKNTKSWFIFLCILLMCVFITAISTSFYRPGPKYILGAYNGFAAVFRYGNDLPEQIFDTRISSFPENVAEKLRKGIIAATDSDLQRLIEDYCS